MGGSNHWRMRTTNVDGLKKNIFLEDVLHVIEECTKNLN